MSQKPRLPFPMIPKKPVALSSTSRTSTASTSSLSTSAASSVRGPRSAPKKSREKKIAYQIADPTNVIETELLRRDLYNDILNWTNSQIGRNLRQDKEVQNLLLRYILNKIITRTIEDDPVFVKTRSKIAETQLKKDFRRLRIQIDANKFIQELEARLAAAADELDTPRPLLTGPGLQDQIPYVEKCYIVYPGLKEEIRFYDVNFCARSTVSSRRSMERNDKLSYLVALNIRYNYLGLTNHQLSAQYYEKYRPNDRITEGFSSYFDHYFDIFATAFPDLEAPLGSIGSFFEIDTWTTPKVFVNPPYDEGLIKAIVDKINDDLEASEKPLEFTLLLPNWKDSRTIQDLKESPWLSSVKEYKKGDLPFLDHMTNTIVYPGDVVEIVLSNAKEAKERATTAKAKPKKNVLEIVTTGVRRAEPVTGAEALSGQVGCIEYLSSLDADCFDYTECMDQNFHLSQIQYYPPEDGNLNVEPLVNLERVLTDDAPQRPYKRRESEEKTVDHWGQRKLLLSEIEFLTLHSRDNDTIVYAGAAPGTHTNYLSRLFPTLKFVLCDPSPFEAGGAPNVEIHTGKDGFFTDEIAQTFANRNDVLFISDIRTQTDEASVKQNMDMQMNWHLIMKPRYSMLKFRLPWLEGQTEYLDGQIYLPIWGPQTTTETRLMVPRNAGMKLYDNTKYESQMFYFNSFTRTTYYARKDLPGPNVPGLDHCYDCSAEICVLCKWIEKYGGSVADIASFMNANSKNSSKTGRTLSVYVSAQTKRQFPSRTYEREEDED